MTRREFFSVGAPLSERSNTYLEDCDDANVWAHMAVGAIANYTLLMRCGLVDARTAIAAMLALSVQE